MTESTPFSWHQPPGFWRARGAHLAALQLGQSRQVTEWPDAPWQDQAGYTLWHYWAVGPMPEVVWAALCASAHEVAHDQLSASGAHPWHLLALRGRAAALQAWERAFGRPALHPWQGDSLLQCAAWSGDLATLCVTLDQAHETVNQGDAQRITPLVTTLYRGTASGVGHLIQAGADPDQTDASARSALHHAALLGDFALLGELEDAGGDPEREDRDGRTPQALFDHRHGMGGAALRAHWAHKYADKLAF